MKREGDRISTLPPLVSLRAPEFNLGLTLESGQVFHWRRMGRGYAGLVGGAPLYVEQCGPSLKVTAGAEELAWRYFALDHPLGEIYATFPCDDAMAGALEFCRGLRIMRQPAWECLAAFITSSLKQVKHIQQMSAAIRARFGRPVNFGGERFFTYPSAARLAEASVGELRECRLGFRAANLIGTARMIADGEVNLDAIASMDDTYALEELCRLPGVGPKIANCVLLFAYGRLKAFPIDVWIERVLRGIYFRRKRNVTARRLKLFSETYFGSYGGYAQQYLFHHARKTFRRAKG
jgi:N-glycosylase/DNA lyase